MKVNVDGPKDLDGDGRISVAERCIWLASLALLLFATRI